MPYLERRSHYEQLLPKWTVDIMQRLQEHHPESYQHSVRTGFIAYSLWKTLEPNDLRPEDLFLAGLVHDSGKIKIEKAILQKKEILTHDEGVIIGKHPYQGALMVSEFDSTIADIIRGHHRWGTNGNTNGKGVIYEDYNQDEGTLAAKQKYSDDEYRLIERAQMVLAIADKADVAINRAHGERGSTVEYEAPLLYERFKHEITEELTNEKFLRLALTTAYDVSTYLTLDFQSL